MDEIEKLKEKKSFTAPRPPFADPSKPPAMAQVVGWPPVRAFRKNMVTATQTQKKDESSESSAAVATGAAYVKVSMDGAPYLRKMDIKMYKSYQELSDALIRSHGISQFRCSVVAVTFGCLKTKSLDNVVSL